MTKGKMKNPPSFNRIESLLAKIFMIFLSLILSFVLFEAYFRLFPKKSSISYIEKTNEIFHAPRPYVMFAGIPEMDHQNVLGYRTSISVEKSKDEYRIIVLGGSTVHHSSLTDFLEKQLHQAGFNQAKVYNFGSTSSVSRQDMVRIMVDVAGYSPDLILHYGGGNDFGFGHDSRINYPHRFILYEKNLSFSQENSLEDWALSFMIGSRFLRYTFGGWLEKKISQKTNINLPPFDQINDLRGLSYLQNLRWGAYLSHKIGAHFVAIYQPTLYFKENLDEQEKPFKVQELVKQVQSLKEIITNQYQKSFKNEFTFFDCSDVFQKSTKKVYRDFIHLADEEDNAIPSACIVDHIKRNRYIERKLVKPAIKFIAEEYFIQGSPHGTSSIIK